jgi:EF-P beta-lysylation protein EpmB
MTHRWRQIQLKNVKSWEKLADFLHLTEEDRKHILPKSAFSLNLPLRLAEKIEKGTLEDPILKQYLPVQKELRVSSGFSLDPVQDQSFRKAPRLLHKYEARALLITTGACAMHCRYCFRRHFPYEGGALGYEEELELIRQDSSLREIILSGGDPLSLGNEELQTLLQKLDQMPSLQRVRFHTKFPIGIPERIDEPFLQMLKDMQKQVIFVIHVNHPKELDDEIFTALKKVQKLGIPVLSQSVLLRGVNDQVAVLKNLFETLSDHGILPYYLHQLDPVEGASHFEVPQEEGVALMQELSKHLSGYSLPRYAKEIPGRPSKVLISCS